MTAANFLLACSSIFSKSSPIFPLSTITTLVSFYRYSTESFHIINTRFIFILSIFDQIITLLEKRSFPLLSVYRISLCHSVCILQAACWKDVGRWSLELCIVLVGRKLAEGARSFASYLSCMIIDRSRIHGICEGCDCQTSLGSFLVSVFSFRIITGTLPTE